MREIKVSANEAGQRLDKLLGKYLNEAPKSFIYKMLRKKNIVLNGKKASGNEKLVLGDSVKLFLADETIEKFSKTAVQKTSGKFDIIYEDCDIVIINKPVGMLSQKADAKDVSVVEYLINYLLDSGQITAEELRSFKPSVCSRLDRNTSGLLVCGKSLHGLQKMAEIFRERSLRKYYRCVVDGDVAKPQYIKGYLVKNEKKNTVTVRETETLGSLPIETEYRPVQALRGDTLLEVHLITGRTHQIRAHLASAGHPIVGDYKYGDRAVNRYYKEQYGLTSQLLHAYRLEMPDKVEGMETLAGKIFSAPLPDLFTKILEGESL